MDNRAHLIIKGKVQGVGYRIFMSEVALSHNLTGWVMNLPDSRMEAVFQGDKKSIQAAIKECSKGTSSATISSVDVNWEDGMEDLTTFMIRY